MAITESRPSVPDAGAVPWRESPALGRAGLWILLVALAVGIGFQGSRGLYESTEGRYTEVAREMLDSGDWLAPTLDHRPHWTKPPLTYWAIAGGVALLGRNAWGGRLYAALAFSLAALGVGVLGFALWGELEGFLAGLVFATSLFPVVAANTVNADTLLALWEIWAVASYWAAVRASSEKSRRRWLVGMWGFFGLAFLTKGPPSLLALLALMAYGGVARRKRWPAAGLWSTAGVIVFALIGLSWYVWAVLTTPGLLRYFLGAEVVARVATDRFGRNPEWWKPLVVYGLPLSLGLGAWLAWRPRRALAGLRADMRGGAGAAQLVFLAIWLALPLAVLSLSRSRLPLYVLPFFPPLVLAFARAQSRIGPSGVSGRPLAARVVVTAVALLLLKLVMADVPGRRDMKPLADVARELAPDLVVVVDGERLYGLQFYLGVPFDRVPAITPTGPASAPLAGAAAGAPPRDLVSVVYVARRPAALEDALSALPEGCSTGAVRRAGVYRLARVTVPPNGPRCLPGPRGS